MSNPVLEKIKTQGNLVGGPPMTMEGTSQKIAILVLVTLIAGFQSYKSAVGMGGGLILLLLVFCFIIGLIVIFAPKTAPVLSWVYALGEGYLIGVVSKLVDLQYPGAVSQAMMGTVGVVLAMLAVYRFKIIRPSRKLALGVFSFMFGISFIYLANIVFRFFGYEISIVNGSSIWSILFSIGVIIVISLSFILDFARIEESVEAGAPKYMEWYAAFGILVSVLWLYLEILRLISKINGRR